MALDASKPLFSELPEMVQGQRGGPRYVRVYPAAVRRCDECSGTIPPGRGSAIDRVRRFGQPPRRWCAACWDAAPQAQVIR